MVDLRDYTEEDLDDMSLKEILNLIVDCVKENQELLDTAKEFSKLTIMRFKTFDKLKLKKS
jgi:hypothetical protein